MYFWYDTFCRMYWNHKKKEWQIYKCSDCLYLSKRNAEEDAYIYRTEDIEIRFDVNYRMALAA